MFTMSQICLVFRMESPFQFDTVATVDDVIQDCIGQCGVIEVSMPVINRQLTGDDGRARVHAIIQYFQVLPPPVGLVINKLCDFRSGRNCPAPPSGFYPVRARGDQCLPGTRCHA